MNKEGATSHRISATSVAALAARMRACSARRALTESSPSAAPSFWLTTELVPADRPMDSDVIATMTG